MVTLKRLFVALGLVALASSASADSYKFHLVNKTTKYTITGFQTYEERHLEHMERRQPRSR